FVDLPTSNSSNMAANVCSTTDTFRLYAILVPFFSATINPAFFRTLKWPDNVDGASGNRSAISPAVMARLRKSRRISRRVGSLKAWNTAFMAYFVISPTTEIVSSQVLAVNVHQNLAA